MARTDQLEMPKAKNRATGVKVSEISFVDVPAVPKARFLVVKRKEESMAEPEKKADIQDPAQTPAKVKKCDSCGGMMQGMDDDDEGEKKNRAVVNYRVGGADTDGDGIVDQCGSCDFFMGPLSLNNDQIYVGECSLVDGDIGSNMLCDLYEVADAFSLVEKSKRLAEVTKEGRMLSAANLDKMKTAMKAAKDAIDAMQGMMDAATPNTAKAKENGKDLTPAEVATLDRIRASLGVA